MWKAVALSGFLEKGLAQEAFALACADKKASPAEARAYLESQRLANAKGQELSERAVAALDSVEESARLGALVSWIAESVIDPSMARQSLAWKNALANKEDADALAWAVAVGSAGFGAEGSFVALKEALAHGAGVLADGKSPMEVFASGGKERRVLVEAFERERKADRYEARDAFGADSGGSLRDLADRMAPRLGYAWSPVKVSRLVRLARAADALMERRGFGGALGKAKSAGEKLEVANALLSETMGQIGMERSVGGKADGKLLALAGSLSDVAEMLGRSGCKKFYGARIARDRLKAELDALVEKLGNSARKLGMENGVGMAQMLGEAAQRADDCSFFEALGDMETLSDGDAEFGGLAGKARAKADGYFKCRANAKRLWGEYGFGDPGYDGDALSRMSSLRPGEDWSDAPQRMPGEVSDDGDLAWPRQTAYELLELCSLASKAAYSDEAQAQAEFFGKAKPLSSQELGLKEEGAGPRGRWKLAGWRGLRSGENRAGVGRAGDGERTADAVFVGARNAGRLMGLCVGGGS